MPVEQLIIRAGKKPLSPRGIMRMDGYGVNSQSRLVGLARRQWGCGDHAKDSHRYILTIPYQTDEELDHIIYEDILAEAHRIADLRNGFVEADVISLDDPERSW
jgi:hypothetical protein